MNIKRQLADFCNIRFGVLNFSYNNNLYLAQQVQEHGECSINLGDYIQSIAVRNALVSIGVREEQIVYVDRDNFCGCDTENVLLIMNGVFYPDNFPIPENIFPVFFGFSYHPSNMFPWNTVEEYDNSLTHLDSCSLIGCRDRATAEILAGKGFKTHVTGCLSQSFLPREEEPRGNSPVLLCGLDDAELSASLSRVAGSYIFFKDQRKLVFEHPLSLGVMGECRKDALSLLDLYKNHVSMAITSLMHCASPCASLGIPTVVVRNDPENIRFSSISEFIPVMSSKGRYSFPELSGMAKKLRLRECMLDKLEHSIRDVLDARF